MSRRTIIWAVAIATTLTVAGCKLPGSSSDGSSSGSSGSTAAASAVDAKKLCTGIPAADVAAIFAQAAGPYQSQDAVTCAYAPTAGATDRGQLEIIVASKKDDGGQLYDGMSRSMGSTHPLSGVGDKAVWASEQNDYQAPDIVAGKGDLECYAKAPIDVTVLTIKQQSSSPPLTDADEAAFATKMGALCNDVFSGK